MLGWRMLKSGDYLLDIPSLSDEEKGMVLEAQERFKEATRTGCDDGEALIGKLIKDVAQDRGLYLDMDQQQYLSSVASMHIHGFGFLDSLLADPEIEEISVIGPGRPVYAYMRGKGWKKVNAVFDEEKAIAEMINRMARKVGRRITMQNPRLDAMLPDGSRLHGSLPPISAGEITIRKFRESPFSPAELVANGTLPMDALAFLSVLMQCDSSLIIAGNTASGKTTTLNALFSFVPDDERVIITEETPEISIPHAHQMRMVANREMGISLKDLVYDSLRMRPDRMIVGEVRSKGEAEALFDVLLAGQARGSYATFHAGSVDEAVSRFLSFGIREMDLRSIDCIVIQRRMLLYDKRRRMNVETRRIVEIAELCDGKKTLFRDGRFCADGTLLRKAAQSFGISLKEMREELRMRKRLISKAPEGFTEFYEHVQDKLYGGRG